MHFHQHANIPNSAITFSEEDRTVPFFHNRPLYVTAVVHGHEFNRTLLDGGASVNIMPLKTFWAAALPDSRLVKDSIEIFCFGNDSTRSVGSVTLGIKMGKLESPITFHVIDADTSYHLLIGRIWMHSHRMIPSSYHQCAKAVVKGKEVKIPATRNPFAVEEAHFADASYFLEFDSSGRPTSSTNYVQLPRPTRPIYDDKPKKTSER